MRQDELPQWMADSHPETVRQRIKATSGVYKIPEALLTSKEIRHPPAAILYGILLGMSSQYERLFAGNEKLMELLGVRSTNSITKYLKELAAGGFVSLSYRSTGRRTERQIKLICIPRVGSYLSIPAETIKDKKLTALQQLIIGCIYSMLWKYKTLMVSTDAGEIGQTLGQPTKTIRNNISILIREGYLKRASPQQLTINLNNYELEEVVNFEEV